MVSTTYDFGKFCWGSSNGEGFITVQVRDRKDPKKQVIQAIRFAKMMRCKIIRRVEYHPTDNGGTTDFQVRCNRFTDRSLYEYGTTYSSYHASGIDIKDVKAYKKAFRTDRTVQPGFRKRFWYSDNWTGLVHTFHTLKKAMEEAKKEVGITVAIYTNFPYGNPSRIKCFAPCSGHMPA